MVQEAYFRRYSLKVTAASTRTWDKVYFNRYFSASTMFPDEDFDLA